MKPTAAYCPEMLKPFVEKSKNRCIIVCFMPYLPRSDDFVIASPQVGSVQVHFVMLHLLFIGNGKVAVKQLTSKGLLSHTILFFLKKRKRTCTSSH